MPKDNSKQKPVARPPMVVPLLPPIAIDRIALIPQLTAAHAAIGELRGFIGGLKNPDLLIAPFRKREAVASSAIEGTRATLDEVMEYEATDESGNTSEIVDVTSKREDIREIMNYERAMALALRELRTRPIGENLIKNTHRVLLRSVRGSTKTPGEFRRAPVAVGDYVPPAFAEIPRLMTNWENYLNASGDEDALIRIGVAHYQFEAIHPFMDGNGRIGRLIIPLALCQQGSLETPVLYISHYLEQYKVEYQRLLHEVDTSQRWTAWLAFFLKAVEEQAKITTAMAKDIQELYERLKGEIVGNGDVAGKIRSQYAIAVLDLIFERPVISASHIRGVISAKSNATAHNLINKFVGAGILRLHLVIGKEKYYEFTELRRLIRG